MGIPVHTPYDGISSIPCNMVFSICLVCSVIRNLYQNQDGRTDTSGIIEFGIRDPHESLTCDSVWSDIGNILGKLAIFICLMGNTSYFQIAINRPASGRPVDVFANTLNRANISIHLV